jgi:tetratricopeptide (TPR) repeat protein
VRPYGEIVMRVDATAGAEAPAKIEVEAVFRGDSAVEANRSMVGKPRDEARRAALRAWSSEVSWAEFKDIDWTYDAAGALFIVTVKGTGKIDWSSSDGVRRWELENTQFSLRQYERDSAQDQTAPYAVTYPTYGRWVTAVQLPDKGEGFKIAGLTVNQVVGGMALRRLTEVHDGRVVMMRSARAMVPEISPADAKIATALAKHDDFGIIAIKLQPADKPAKGGDKTDEKSGAALMTRGYEAWSAGRVDEAQKLFEKARDADPAKTRPWEALVNVWLSRKDYARALEISDQAARKDSAHPEIWKSNRAGVLVQAGRADEAVTELTTALAASPKSTPLLLALARAHRAQDHADLAGQDLDRALAAAPDDTEVIGRRAEQAVFVKDYATAARLVETIIAKEPDEAWGFQQLANVYVASGNTDEALRQVDEALRIDPFDPSALTQRAGINLERKRYDLALVDTDRALALRPDIPSLWNERCWVRAVWGQELDKAQADCDAALKAMPKMAAALDSRGLVNLRQGRFEAAVRDYDAALVLSPKQAASLYGRGLVKLKLGDKTAAQADLTAAVAADAGIGKRFEGYGLKAD